MPRPALFAVTECSMNNLLVRNWWTVMVRGVAALAFGLITLVVPGITLGALLMVFGAFVIVDGLFSLAAGIKASGHRERWGSLVVLGVTGLAAGLIALFAPIAAAVGFALLIGVWSLVTGVSQILAAIRLRRVIENEWLMGLGGALSVALGLVFLLLPDVAMLTLVWWVGLFATTSGIMLVALALRLRNAFDKRFGGTWHPSHTIWEE